MDEIQKLRDKLEILRDKFAGLARERHRRDATIADLESVVVDLKARLASYGEETLRARIAELERRLVAANTEVLELENRVDGLTARVARQAERERELLERVRKWRQLVAESAVPAPETLPGEDG